MTLPDSVLRSLVRLIEAGVASSAEKLSSMSGTRWALQTVSVNAEPGDRLRTSLGGSQPHYGAFFNMPGGFFLVLISEPSGKALAGAYLGSRAVKMQVISDLEQAALAEIFNVIVNSVAAALADACDIGFLMSAPKMAHGIRRDLLDQVLQHFPTVNLAVTSYVHMTSLSLSADCAMIILFDRELAQCLMNSMNRPGSKPQ